jgi:Uma2 family endonuclease
VKPLTVEGYFQLPESMRPMELVFGFVREPPAPGYGHQSAVTRLTVLLALHVREHDLGQVCVSPVDVVLDASAGLVVQPDIIFVAHANRGIVRDRVWGAPDLVVEILSPGTEKRDRTTKLGWYQRYGVTEAWLVDAAKLSIEVIGLTPGRKDPAYADVFTGDVPMRSAVLPCWSATACQILG